MDGIEKRRLKIKPAMRLTHNHYFVFYPVLLALVRYVETRYLGSITAYSHANLAKASSSERFRTRRITFAFVEHSAQSR